MLILQKVYFDYDRFSLKNIDLNITKGSQTAIIGESGCGKTTLLKLIYGLYDCTEGAILWNNNLVTGPAHNLVPGMPYMKYLSQDFDLMPFTTVAENVQKFLSRRLPKESEARTALLLEVVEMTAYANVKVKTLSGGQKQRVALAQTLAKEPELLLLDEPFSHIDNFRKNNLRRKLFAYLKSQQITCLIATHDSTDILSYTDSVVVMKNGKIIANNPTQELYKNPPSLYVASLFGEVNALPKHWFKNSALHNETLICYPHQLKVSTLGIKATVKNTYFKGSYWLIEASYQGHSFFFSSLTQLKENSTHPISLCDF